MRKVFGACLVALLLAGAVGPVRAAVWQWSVPDGTARAYLWIPPHCGRVRAAVVANHNMIEQGILEHPTMRRTLTQLGIAEVWVVPAMDARFDFHQGAGEHFQRIMDALAAQSGYQELKFTPVIPIGHSACATYPWNFAAWNPARTLAVLSVHGDAPQTDRTGYGGPNVPWDGRNIDGVPGLMVMGENEWGEDRILPALDFQAKHPATPLAFLADAGNGHYNYSDRLVAFLAMFIAKAAAQRLPADAPLDGPVTLIPIDPRNGWRIERWHKDQTPPTAPAAPYARYMGDPKQAFWCWDREMAQATEAYYANARGKKPQLVGAMEDGTTYAGEPAQPPFPPSADGSFSLQPLFLDTVSGSGTNPARWTGLPNGTPLGHATGGGPIVFSRIVGPVALTGPDTFTVSLDRSVYTPNGRNHDLWLLVSQPGDAHYKSAVQPLLVHLPDNTEGAAQKITFPRIPDQKAGVRAVTLAATSDAGLPVHYYVREGPAEVEGSTLRVSDIPPRTKFPMEVTIVAWQWGRSLDPKVQTATPVEQTFHITK